MNDVGGFFTQPRPPSPNGPGPDLGGAPPAAPTGSPILGILAVLLVGGGLAVTILGGNQGGLLGMPVMLLGVLLGAIAWGRGLGKMWGQVAVLGALGFVALAVLAAIAGF